MFEDNLCASETSRLHLRIVLAIFVAVPLLPRSLPAQNAAPPVHITLDQALQLAAENNHALKAAQNQILQNQAEEVTAAIRPNPVFIYDDLFVPLAPGDYNSNILNNITEFDVGFAYTWERGRKRQARIRAAKDQTAITGSQVNDTARGLTFNVAQQFINVLLAKSTLELAEKDLQSFQQTVDLSQHSYQAGSMSENDLLKIKLQLLQFQTDVSMAKLSLIQGLASLRQLLGLNSVPADYAVDGELDYKPLPLNKEDLQLLALKNRPDLMAAQQGITAAQSQYTLAKANGKRDVTTTLDYTHVGGINSASFIFNIEIPIFDRNQGEIARTHYAIDQSQQLLAVAQDQVMTDVTNAYEGLKTSEQVVKIYTSGYLKQAQESLEISEYAYRRGATGVLDFLDAERSYRATQLAYRQALANYQVALEQVREAVGTRNLP
jgi:outer membrane protein, heavy metal efflux system